MRPKPGQNTKHPDFQHFCFFFTMPPPCARFASRLHKSKMPWRSINSIKLFLRSCRLYLWDANRFPVAFPHKIWYFDVVFAQERHHMAPSEPKLDLLQGTLDLMVLQTLDRKS